MFGWFCLHLDNACTFDLINAAIFHYPLDLVTEDGNSSVYGDNSEIARKLAEAALLAEKLKKKEEAAKRAARAKEATRRAAIFAKFKKKQLEEFQKQFNTFDADRSGEIDFDEMKAMVRGLGMDTPGHVLIFNYFS
eukprot:g4489.t1